MSFTGIFGLVLLGVIAIALLGPSKLPAGVEQIWLMISNLRRSQSQLPPLNIEQARVMWARSENPLYDLIQILYGSVEHLLELRHRIFAVVIALVIGGILSAFFANQISGLLLLPAHKNGIELIALKPTDNIFVYFEIILSTAVIVALPVALTEMLMFIRPALETPDELSIFKGIAILGMPLVAIFFLCGLAFAFFVMLPVMLPFLYGFGQQIAKPTWEVRGYITFTLTVLLWVGLAFETPLIMAMLARLGLVSPQAMAKQWRWAIVGVAITAAAITPTVDPVNMSVVMVPLLALYFLGIAFARAVYRKRPARAAEAQPGA
jgi:sec-independent protein translocase protein TatC